MASVGWKNTKGNESHACACINLSLYGQDKGVFENLRAVTT